MTVQEFTATEENYYAGAINWNLLFSAELDTAVLDREQARVYSLVYRPLFRDKIGAALLCDGYSFKRSFTTISQRRPLMGLKMGPSPSQAFA